VSAGARELSKPDRRRCEICFSPIRRLLYDQQFVAFDDDSGLLPGYDLTVCARCGFVYADGIPEQVVFERYYREMSKHEPELDPKFVPQPYRQHNCDLIASQVTAWLPDRASRILDVGIGGGDVLVALRKRGYTDLTGVDPSARSVEVAQRKHGLRVLQAPISTMTFSTERFDLILLSGVLEHLRDLQPTLLRLRTLLRENGRICVAVPDAARFAEAVESPYQFLSVEHVNFFTRRTLEMLFCAVDMQLQSYREETALLGVFKEPIVHAIFRAGRPAPLSIPDATGLDEMACYLARSRSLQDRLVTRIHSLVDSREGIIVWGVGSLTLHLLSDATVSQLNIRAFVDANSKYWYKTIRGVPVLPPACMRQYRESILVLSYSYEDEICWQIAHQYKLQNKVVRLFAESDIVAAP
jgi:2-polyprenyl-3-methyl-5-hydroxy-6-metoxy-1,4-benzoquinol methylase